MSILALIASVVFAVVRLTADPPASASSIAGGESTGDPGKTGPTDGATPTDEPTPTGSPSPKPEEWVDFPDACEIVRADAVERLLPDAAAISVPADLDAGEPGRCEWYGLTSTEPLAYRQVWVQIGSADQMGTWREGQQENDIEVTDQPDLGDGAFSIAYSGQNDADPVGVGGIYLTRGDLAIHVLVVGWKAGSGPDAGSGGAVAVEPATALEESRALVDAVVDGPSWSGPFARPAPPRDKFDNAKPRDCDPVSRDLAARLLGTDVDPASGATDEGGCWLAERRQQPGPNGIGDRELTIEVEDHDDPDAALREYRRKVGVRRASLIQASRFESLPKLGDSAALIAGWRRPFGDDPTPEVTSAMLVVRRGSTVITFEHFGSDLVAGSGVVAESEPMDVDTAANGILEVARAYFA